MSKATEKLMHNAAIKAISKEEALAFVQSTLGSASLPALWLSKKKAGSITQTAQALAEVAIVLRYYVEDETQEEKVWNA